jgi:hypothetical protein
MPPKNLLMVWKKLKMEMTKRITSQMLQSELENRKMILQDQLHMTTLLLKS